MRKQILKIAFVIQFIVYFMFSSTIQQTDTVGQYKYIRNSGIIFLALIFPWNVGVQS